MIFPEQFCRIAIEVVGQVVAEDRAGKNISSASPSTQPRLMALFAGISATQLDRDDRKLLSKVSNGYDRQVNCFDGGIIQA
jgi:hypothetical protein